MGHLELERAEDLLRQGRYAEAIDRFRELLSMEPERADLRGRVAEAYRLAGNLERAFHHFHKAAALYGRQGDLLGSARMLEAANQVSPNEPDVLFRLAEVLEKLGKHRPLQVVLQNLVRAASAPGDRRRLWALDALVARNPNDLDAQVERAKVLSEVGRVREAVLVWQQIADHLAARGVDFAPWLERAARAEPERTEIGVALAHLLLRHERPKQALALLVPYYEKFPDDVPLLETLLDAVRAIGAADKVLPAQLELLKARTRVGQRAEALTEVKALLGQAPQDPRVLEVSAHACAAFGLRGEACRLWFDVARLYDRHQMTAQRDRAVLRILELEPDHEGALALGARVLRAGGRLEEAVQLEARLAEVRARSVDELPALEDEMPDLSAAPGALAPEPPSQPRTMVLGDEDVLEVTAEADSVSDVFDSRTPAEATVAAPPSARRDLDLGPRADDLALDPVDDSTETGEMPAYDPSAAPGRPGLFEDPFSSDTAEEMPASTEEATSRMDDGTSAQLQALRRELDDDEATAIELDAQPAEGDTAPVPQRRRPGARLVSDLLHEVVDDEEP